MQITQKPHTEYRDNLFDLIKSLTKAEKGYFKKHITGFGAKESNYLKLFEAYDQMLVFDETIFRKKFANQKFIKRPDAAKGYLYEMILKSLRSYHSASGSSILLSELLIDIEVLFNKGLFDLCLKKINQALKTATVFEQKKYMLMLLEWEKKVLCAGLKLKDFQIRHIQINKQEKEIVCLLENMLNYSILDSQMFLLNRSNPARRSKIELKKFESIYKNELVRMESNALSFQAKIMQYGILVSYFYAAGKIKECYNSNLKLLNLLDNHPEIKKESRLKYIYTLRNHIAIATRLKKYKDVNDYLKILKSVPVKTKKEQVMLFEFATVLELNLSIKVGQFKEGVSKIVPIQKKWEEYNGLLDKQQKLLCYYLFVVLYFGDKNYSKSLFWANKIINDGELDIRHDVYCFIKIFNLILHYELNNYDTLEYLIKSTYRFLLKRKKIYKVETVALEIIKHLPKIKTKNELLGLLRTAREKLVLIEKNEFEKIAFDYFDFISWLTAKIEDRSFAEIIQKQTLNKSGKRNT